MASNFNRKNYIVSWLGVNGIHMILGLVDKLHYIYIVMGQFCLCNSCCFFV